MITRESLAANTVAKVFAANTDIAAGAEQAQQVRVLVSKFASAEGATQRHELAEAAKAILPPRLVEVVAEEFEAQIATFDVA